MYGLVSSCSLVGELILLGMQMCMNFFYLEMQKNHIFKMGVFTLLSKLHDNIYAGKRNIRSRAWQAMPIF